MGESREDDHGSRRVRHDVKLSRIKIRKENSRIADRCYPRWMNTRYNVWQIMRVRNFPDKPRHFGAHRDVHINQAIGRATYVHVINKTFLFPSWHTLYPPRGALFSDVRIIFTRNNENVYWIMIQIFFVPFQFRFRWTLVNRDPDIKIQINPFLGIFSKCVWKYHRAKIGMSKTEENREENNLIFFSREKSRETQIKRQVRNG